MFCLIFQHIIIWCFCWYCCEDSLSVLLHSCQTKSISVSRFLFSYFMSSFSFLAASWGKEWFPCVIIKVVRFRGYTVSTCVVHALYGFISCGACGTEGRQFLVYRMLSPPAVAMTLKSKWKVLVYLRNGTCRLNESSLLLIRRLFRYQLSGKKYIPPQMLFKSYVDCRAVLRKDFIKTK